MGIPAPAAAALASMHTILVHSTLHTEYPVFGGQDSNHTARGPI